MYLKTASKRAIQKTSGVTVELLGDKIVGKIAKVVKTSLKNQSETVTNEKNIGLERNTQRKI